MSAELAPILPLMRRGTAEFRALLRRYRGARRWSQDRLASEAEMDHSLVSRLESGQRTPTRESIDKLAAGLGLTEAQHDALLAAARFLPLRPESSIADEPEMLGLYRLLKDERVPVATRGYLREMVRGMVRIANQQEG